MSKKSHEIYNILFKEYPELHVVLKDVGVLDLESLMKNVYPALIGVIVGQRISFKRAKQIRKMLYTALGGTNFSRQDVENTQRQEIVELETWPIIKGLNEYLSTKDDDFLNSIDNIKMLKSLKGIGEWTIESTILSSMITKECPENVDIFPSGDKFLQNALNVLFSVEGEEKMTPVVVRKLTKRWAPYRGYVTWYLWRWFPEIRTKNIEKIYIHRKDEQTKICFLNTK